jgi:hypothetical protein
MAFCCSVLLLHQLPRSYSALFANRGRPICSETVADLLRDGVRPAPRSLLTWSEIRTASAFLFVLIQTLIWGRYFFLEIYSTCHPLFGDVSHAQKACRIDY